MKKTILIIAISLVVISSCQKRGDACISADKTTAAMHELITISNCADELPSSRVTTSLDWGDGNTSNGQIGTHAYDTTGTYNIRLLLNGDYAADVADVDESKVKITITIQ